MKKVVMLFAVGVFTVGACLMSNAEASDAAGSGCVNAGVCKITKPDGTVIESTGSYTETSAQVLATHAGN